MEMSTQKKSLEYMNWSSEAIESMPFVQPMVLLCDSINSKTANVYLSVIKSRLLFSSLCLSLSFSFIFRFFHVFAERELNTK